MPDFLIIAPTVHEAAPFFAALDPRKKPALGACARAGNAACVVSGIGCEKSAERVEAAAKEFRPRAVILAGFGGACKADLKKGDLVYETRSEELAALGSRLRGVRGKIAFCAGFADGRQKALLASQGFDAAEMEGGFFRKALENFSVEFAQFRWISDGLYSEAPKEFFERAMDRQSGALNMGFGMVAREIAKSPSLLLKLIKFGIEIAPAQKSYARGARELAEFLKSARRPRACPAPEKNKKIY
ncbi:MAG: hypothetical protein IJI37_01625 [Opitutales bacterium]|nr:hypothetical protein [Opitutales bacterium]